MATRFKEIYHKSFRCFSDIFDDEKEKEKEMEIGYPTDVRHVSHIGWDSSSSSAPSWLHNFKTSNNHVSEPNSSWPFEDLKTAMEAFGEEEKKWKRSESKKEKVKRRLSAKASLLCNTWSPRSYSTSTKLLV